MSSTNGSWSDLSYEIPVLILHYPAPEDLEVASFGVMGGIGVVGACPCAIKDLETFAVAVRRFGDEVFELLFGDETRAGAGYEE